MTTVDRVAPSPLPVPGRIGQATAVEQSRAVAEVQAAVVVAQQCPRNIQSAIAEMRASCAQLGLAERSFYRFPRAGATVTGPSVYLARELARCWGNVQYGIAELSRDDGHGQSEMQAFAWDVQTNSRNSSTFVVPHKRDTREGVKAIVDMRDIYENNANQGARRMREAILAILPPWFVEEAKDLCAKTLAGGGGKPIAQRTADAVSLFGALGITAGQLETKLGRKSGQWTEHDLAQLSITYRSIQRGEVTTDEEFAPERVTAAEITAGAEPAQPATRSREKPAARIRKPQSDKMHALAGELDLDRDARIGYTNEVLRERGGDGYRQVESSKDLTEVEAGWVLDKLQSWASDIEPPEDGEPA